MKNKFLVWVAVLISIPGQAYAISPSDLHAVLRDTVWYEKTQCDTTPTSSEGGSTIVLDPGHSGQDKSITDPDTGLIDHDYPNDPEMEEVFAIAQDVGKELEKDGYKVILTKQQANDTVSLRERANIANESHAALAVSIHDDHGQPWGSFAEVYVPQIGLHRDTNSGEQVKFSDAAVASKSQAYGDIFAQERTQTEGHAVSVAVNSFNNRPGISPGNIPMVELFSKVPWVYNEVGAAPEGVRLSETKLKQYTDGLIKSIEKAVPKTATPQPTSGLQNLFFPVAYAAPAGTPVVSDTLQGHRLPATKGGTGQEQNFDHYGLGSAANQEEQDYYITMRWRFVLWNWNGTAATSGAKEQGAFYQNHPKVLVTNSRTHKSIIAIALESGPAPWTGVDTGSNNDPKQGWHNPQDGTPPTYKGRVSGFVPKGLQALGATQRMQDGSGDDLLFAWAPDQNAKLGPTDISVGNYDRSQDGQCAGQTGNASGGSIVEIAKAELALGLQGTGPMNNSGPVCKYQGSACGEAWCADFVSWVYKQAGHPFTGGADGGWRLAAAAGVKEWMVANGRYTTRQENKFAPQLGDIVYEEGQPDHIGLVSEINGHSLKVLSGNGSGAGISERTSSDWRTDTKIRGWGGLK